MISTPTLTVTKMVHSWSKWGGSRIRSIYADFFEPGVWFCQECGEKQSVDMPSWLIPLDYEGLDYLRVCALCKNKMVVKRLIVAIDVLDAKNS